MEESKKREILECIQRACEKITKGYHEQTGRADLEFRVLQLKQKGDSKLQEGEDLIRKGAQLYDEYEGNEEYIHIPSIEQMLENLQKHIVIGIEDTKTGELEGVTTIKYYENKGGEVNPYYPREDTKYFEITGVIVKQRGDMTHKGLGTNMYEACFLGLYEYVKEHPEGYRMDAVIDCTNIKSLYAAKNAIKNINARGLVGEGKRLNLFLAGLYVVRDPQTRALVEAPTFVLESDLKECNSLSKIEERQEEGITFVYRKPKKTKTKAREYRGLQHSILRRMNQSKKERHNEALEKEGLNMANELLGNVEKEKAKVTRNLDEEAGYVDFIDLSDMQVAIEEMNLRTNGSENIGARRNQRRDVGNFVGPMPNVIIESTESKDYDEEER